MEQAQLPWDPKRRLVWPASFRRAVRTLMLVSRRLARDQTRDMALPKVVWLRIASFCGRGWFDDSATTTAEEAAAPLGGALPAPRLACEWCQVSPMRTELGRPGALKRCSKCHAARFCSTECIKAAWETHKAACKTERKRQRKKEKEKAAAKAANAQHEEAAQTQPPSAAPSSSSPPPSSVGAGGGAETETTAPVVSDRVRKKREKARAKRKAKKAMAAAKAAYERGEVDEDADPV